MRARRPLTRLALLFGYLLAGFGSHALALDWSPVHRSKTYAVSGVSGIDLYRDIGAKGPKVGLNLAIGLTEWDLRWRRDYRQESGDCRIASVTPFLTITTTLPKAENLSGPLARAWEDFVSGIAQHESVHARFLIDFTDAIINETLGFEVSGDADCSKTKAEVQRRVKELYASYRQNNADFERVEMGEGGAVRQLILDLVNGPQAFD